MKAWYLTQTATPLVPVEIAEPVPGPGEVLLDMRAAGMCHSDVGFWDGTLDSGLDHKPIVLGHENAGVISALGPGVTGFEFGDRVAAYPIETEPYPGTGRDGGYAAKTLEPASGLIRIPAQVSFTQAAAATDAGMTACHAILATAKVGSGSRVGIIGLGALGMIGAQVAVLAGAQVYGADVNAGVFTQARNVGVTECFTDVADLQALRLDVIVDFAGMQTTILGAVQAVQTGGRVVLVGLGAREFTIPTMLFASRQIELVGSWGGTKNDITEVLEVRRRSTVRFSNPPALARHHAGSASDLL